MRKTAFSLISFACTLLIFLFSSCSKKSKNDDDIQQMEESLINASKQINLSTETFLKALEDKTTDPLTMERAKFWYPKAERIAQLSNEIYKYLDTVKMQLKETKLPADMLYKKLINYKENVLFIDSSIRQEFNDNFNFSKPISKTIKSSLATTVQNNIRIIENKIIAYCDTKVWNPGHGFDSYSVIVGQNSIYLKKGDILEIKAGVGAFSKAAQPKIIISGNQSIEIGEEGYGLYKMKITNSPGHYIVPVKIDFHDQTTGKDKSMLINVEYTVAKECNQ